MRLLRKNDYQSADELLAAVKRHLRRMSEFSMWTTGTTDDPGVRYDELDAPAFWCHWEAASSEVAESVKGILIQYGMRLDPRDKPGRVLYVF